MASPFKKRATECIYSYMTEKQVQDEDLVDALFKIETIANLTSIVSVLAIDIDRDIYITVRIYHRWLLSIAEDEIKQRSSPIHPVSLFSMASPSAFPLVTSKSIPDGYLSTAGQLKRKGILPDSPEGVKFIEERKVATQLAASTSLELSCPVLHTSDQREVMTYTDMYKSYNHKHGVNCFTHGIESAARHMITVDAYGAGISIDWDGDDETIIRHILDLYCGDTVGLDTSLAQIFEGVSMKPSDTFNLKMMKEYQGKFHARCVLFDVPLRAFSMKDKIDQFLHNIYPKHYVKLIRQKLSDLTDWPEIWRRVAVQNASFRSHLAIEDAKGGKKPEKKDVKDVTKDVDDNGKPKYTKHNFARMVDAGVKSALKDIKSKAKSNKPPKQHCKNCPCEKSHNCLEDCRQACSHEKCKMKSLHLATTCPAWKSAASVTLLTPEESEVGRPSNMKIAHATSNITCPGQSGRRTRGLKIRFDTGSNVLITPAIPSVLRSSPVQSMVDSVTVANGESSSITGVSPIGGVPCMIAPSFDSMLVPQLFVEKQDCCTLLLDKKLIVCNHAGKQAIKQLIASEPAGVCCTIPAINGLYNLSTDDMLAILDSQKGYSELNCSSVVSGTLSSQYVSQSLTRYHTVEFHNLKDVVFFWHRVWRHASEKQMIRIVGDEKHPSVFQNVPRELTAAVIRKYFRQIQCLDCPLGNLHL